MTDQNHDPVHIVDVIRDHFVASLGEGEGAWVELLRANDGKGVLGPKIDETLLRQYFNQAIFLHKHDKGENPDA